MRKTIIASIIFIIIVLCFTGIVQANSIDYYGSGGIDTITVENGYISYYTDGYVDEISVNTGLIIDGLMDGDINEIITPSGTLDFNLDGEISAIYGDFDSIIKDVQTGINEINKSVTNYLNSINIAIPGAANPSESAGIITKSLNDFIDKLNNSPIKPTVIVSGNTTSDSKQQVNQQVSINQNGIDINDESSQVQMGQSGLNINEGNSQVQIGENGLYINDDSGSVSIGKDGLSITTGNEAVTIGPFPFEITLGNTVSVGAGSLSDSNSDKTDGVNISLNAEKQGPSITTLIIIGLLLLIAFLVLIFGIYKIKKDKGQVVVK